MAWVKNKSTLQEKIVPGDRIADKVTFEWSYHSISCIVRYLMSRTNRAVACDPRTRLNHFLYRRFRTSATQATELLLKRSVLSCVFATWFGRIYMRSFQLTSREYKSDPMNKEEKHPLPSASFFVDCRQTTIFILLWFSTQVTMIHWLLGGYLCPFVFHTPVWVDVQILSVFSIKPRGTTL